MPHRSGDLKAGDGRVGTFQGGIMWCDCPGLSTGMPVV